MPGALGVADFVFEAGELISEVDSDAAALAIEGAHGEVPGAAVRGPGEAHAVEDHPLVEDPADGLGVGDGGCNEGLQNDFSDARKSNN